MPVFSVYTDSTCIPMLANSMNSMYLCELNKMLLLNSKILEKERHFYFVNVFEFPQLCVSHTQIVLYRISFIEKSSTATAKSLQSCPTLCDPIPGILQARTLEWVAIPFSNA